MTIGTNHGFLLTNLITTKTIPLFNHYFLQDYPIPNLRPWALSKRSRCGDMQETLGQNFAASWKRAILYSTVRFIGGRHGRSSRLPCVNLTTTQIDTHVGQERMERVVARL